VRLGDGKIVEIEIVADPARLAERQVALGGTFR